MKKLGDIGKVMYPKWYKNSNVLFLFSGHQGNSEKFLRPLKKGQQALHLYSIANFVASGPQ